MTIYEFIKRSPDPIKYFLIELEKKYRFTGRQSIIETPEENYPYEIKRDGWLETEIIKWYIDRFNISTECIIAAYRAFKEQWPHYSLEDKQIKAYKVCELLYQYEKDTR